MLRRLLNNLFRPSAHCGNFFISGVKPAIGVEVANNANRRIAHLTAIGVDGIITNDPRLF